MTYWIVVVLLIVAAIACGGFGYLAAGGHDALDARSMGWLLAGAVLFILALLLILGRLLWWLSGMRPFGAIAALAVAAGLVLAQAPEARAGDLPVISAEQCVAFADLAIVAGAAAKIALERPLADAILRDTYDLRNPTAAAIAARITDLAYAAPPESPGEFAAAFARRCIAAGGRLDAVFGTAL